MSWQFLLGQYGCHGIQSTVQCGRLANILNVLLRLLFLESFNHFRHWLDIRDAIKDDADLFNRMILGFGVHKVRDDEIGGNDAKVDNVAAVSAPILHLLFPLELLQGYRIYPLIEGIAASASGSKDSQPFGPQRERQDLG